MNIALQLIIKPAIPTIFGPIDYRIFYAQLEEIDSLLITSGIEEEFLVKSLEEKELSKKQIRDNPEAKIDEHVLNRPSNINRLCIAFRTTILGTLIDERYRRLSFFFADSTIAQWFIGIGTPVGGATPAKSSIERYEKFWSKEEISDLIKKLNNIISEKANSEKLLSSELPLDFTHYYADSTCIESNIHHPVDWLLLRDAVRTLTASIKTIRAQGLLHRMKSPDSFLSKMNSLTMSMTEASRNRSAEGKKKQKAAFRSMRDLLNIVVKHAERYKKLLEENWETTEWSKSQMLQVIKRIDNVLEQVPDIIKIAYKRIIQHKQTKNADKILSLYEKNVHVIKRGKAQGDIEFGNKFYLAEQENGLIVDWDYFKAAQTSDARIFKDSISRISSQFTIKSMTTDRGFDSVRNRKVLADKGIYNSICPKDPNLLQERLKEGKFCAEQKRRSQTEGRIGIFKSKFIGSKIQRKGFENGEKKILWSIFTHNIWVIARIAIENKESKLEAA